VPKPRPDDIRLSASQLVAHNLTRARLLRGLTQAEIAERLARFTGAKWSQATVAQAEGSVRSPRTRQFTANELVALARTFDLPVLYFLMPPDDGVGGLLTDDAKDGLPWQYLLVLLLGHRGTFPVLADRAANWAELLAQGIDIPSSDALADPETILAEIAGSLRRREPLLPEDVLAAVFHGLAARRIRGAKQPDGDLTNDVARFADNLHGLANALTAFNNYRPGEFVDERVVTDVARTRRQRERRRRAAADAVSAATDDGE
jgi:transcriptional regulator with XRE-family HTH domain